MSDPAITSAADRPIAVADKVLVRALPPCARFLVRGAEGARAKASTALTEKFGIDLPSNACRSSRQGDYAGLWLGPDEWLVLAPIGDLTAIRRALDEALSDTPHALVDVSDRHLALQVAGALAADVLNTACPLDLGIDAFPVGMCTRTLLGKAEVTLWRMDPEAFRIESQRSFAPYHAGLLDDAVRALTAF